MEHTMEPEPDVSEEATLTGETFDVRAVEPDCPKCTGPMVTCDVGHVGIYGWWLERIVRPAGVLGPIRSVTSDVRALTCTKCGYTEFYAVRPQALTSLVELH